MPPDQPPPGNESQLVHLAGRIDSVLIMIGAVRDDVSRLARDLDALFSRQRQLERQVSGGIALLAALVVLLPILAGMLNLRISATPSPAPAPVVAVPGAAPTAPPAP